MFEKNPFIKKILGDELFKELDEVQKKIVAEWQEKWEANSKEHKIIAEALQEILKELKRIKK